MKQKDELGNADMPEIFGLEITLYIGIILNKMISRFINLIYTLHFNNLRKISNFERLQ